MNLIIRKRAADAISNTAAWVNEINTDGAGDRWFDRLVDTLRHASQTGVKHALCRNKELAKRQYHCFTYNNKWVIAYKIINDDFIVYRFILGAKLG